MVHVSTQTPPAGGQVERGEDVVELMAAPHSPYSSSSSSLQDTQGSSASGEPTENRIPLIDNSPLLAHDPSTKKFTSLTNEGVCVGGGAHIRGSVDPTLYLCIHRTCT